MYVLKVYRLYGYHTSPSNSCFEGYFTGRIRHLYKEDLGIFPSCTREIENAKIYKNMKIAQNLANKYENKFAHLSCIFKVIEISKAKNRKR